MFQYHIFPVVALVAGIIAMAMAVRKDEAGARRLSLVFYVLSVALVVTSARLASIASAS